MCNLVSAAAGSLPVRPNHARLRRSGMLSFLLGALLLLPAVPASAVPVSPPPAAGDIVGLVRDSASGSPLRGATVLILAGSRTVARTQSDPYGRFRVHNLAPGSYDVSVRLIGFEPARRTALVDAGGGDVDLDFRLRPAPVQLQEVTIGSAPVAVAVDTRSGAQVFDQNAYHGAPTQTTSQIVQQSVAGAARAPTGEVHIRGQHAEYTYYVDGVPVPAGISGSLNEIFNPDVVNEIQFQTGSWDAEYGNKNAAIVNVETRIPAGGLRADGSVYAGSYNSNGATLDLSQNAGKFGWFVSGTRQETAMRREPVVVDTSTGAPVNFSNYGQDVFGFGKLQYTPGALDAVDLDLSWSRTRFHIPYDSSGGAFLNDRQQDINGFANLSWRHQFPGGDASQGSDLFSAVFHRRGSLRYTPSAADEPQFVFFPDTTAYNITEDRSFNTTGVKLDFTHRWSERLSVKVGGLASVTRGHEDFSTLSASGGAGPASNSGLSGSDEWVYAQTVMLPVEKVEIRAGLRYDNHNAPFAGNRDQISPRLKLTFFPDPATSVWAYYGRMFIPTNVEDLRAITSVAQGGVVAQPTLPERDDFYEVGLIHRFPMGMVTKLSAYHKYSSPGIDDNTVPGSAITTSVNIAHVWIDGVEAVLEIQPPGRVSGYLNFALNHAYGRGPITGGFFPTDTPDGYFDLDHDQRISALATVNYADSRAFASITGTYGSGLTNGEDPGAGYGTGLFDFNSDIKVDPSLIFNASVGYIVPVGGILLRPEVYVENVLNHHYLLKGAFFSGASAGRPRLIQLRLNFAI